MPNKPFIWGDFTDHNLPLEKYLPSTAQGTTRRWLKTASPGEGFILMPFGSTPFPALEAARAGYRVLVPVNNPITRFLFTNLANPPSTDQLSSSLAQLASAYKGKERLEPHIQSLYETHCPHCGTPTPAKAFLWIKTRQAPTRKVCFCSRCADSGEFPVSEEDIHKAQSHQPSSLYHARALTRIAPPGDPVRPRIEKALQAYPPRTVYALFTLINKIIGLDLNGQKRSHLDTLLLHAFLQCLAVDQPWQLENLEKIHLPEQYREENVWYALEDAVQVWSSSRASVPLTHWPDQPPDRGGITIYPGRFRDLAPLLEPIQISAAVLTIPRPNPGYWAFSALWTGWLWGQDSAAPLKNLLSLEQLDWAWHARALWHVFSELNEVLQPGSPCFAAVNQLDPDFLTAAVTAGDQAGLSFTSLALDSSQKSAQLEWTITSGPSPNRDNRSREILRDGGYSLLRERGEPSPTISVLGAGLSRMAEQHAFPAPEPAYETSYQDLEEDLEETLAYRQGFLLFPDIDSIWHQELNLDSLPLNDRIEEDLVQYLLQHPRGADEEQIFTYLYQLYPGLMTPEADFVQLCLRSYAEISPSQTNLWKLKEQENPDKRREDIQEMEQLLVQVGEKIGFQPERKPPLGNIRTLIWQTNQTTKYTFFISASSHLVKILMRYTQTPTHPWIVLPASRAELILHKLHINPPLQEYFTEEWNFVKYRHIRRLVDEGSLTISNLQERLGLDPFSADDPQLLLI